MTLVHCAFAQSPDKVYPQKPIRVIVPFAAGGPTDLISRALAPKLDTAFGQSLIIDKRGHEKVAAV